MKAKKLFTDKEALKKALQAADIMVRDANLEIIKPYQAQHMLPELTTDIFRDLLQGKSARLREMVREQWRSSMNDFKPGLGDASPVLPEAVNLSPARFDRYCDGLTGGSMLANPNVKHTMIKIVDGQAVIDDEAREAIADALTVYATDQNKAELAAYTKLADAANEVHKLLDEKRRKYEEETGLPKNHQPKLIGDGTITAGYRPNVLVYYSKLDNQYKVNHEKLTYGAPRTRKRPPVKIEPKPDVVPKPKPKPEVTKLQRYKTSIPG